MDAELQYEVVSSCVASSVAESFHESLTCFICEAAKVDKKAVPLPGCAHDHQEQENDMIRPRARRPHRLAGDAAHTEREQDNRDALSGMRNPRLSLKRVPGHLAIGAKVTQALEAIVTDDPRIIDNTMAAVGDSS